jgi:hypothetical protein
MLPCPMGHGAAAGLLRQCWCRLSVGSGELPAQGMPALVRQLTYLFHTAHSMECVVYGCQCNPTVEAHTVMLSTYRVMQNYKGNQHNRPPDSVLKSPWCGSRTAAYGWCHVGMVCASDLTARSATLVIGRQSTATVGSAVATCPVTPSNAPRNGCRKA